MQSFAVIVAAAVLAGTSLACSVDLGGPRLKIGPVETLTFHEAVPAGAQVVDLTINLTAGQLAIDGGATGVLEGEIRDNVVDWVPTVTMNGGTIEVDQGTTNQNGSGLELFGSDIVNDWTLHLGDIPYNLTINAGAYAGTLDLSGVPLQSVSISDGASESEVVFSSPNPVAMSTFMYSTGASEVTLRGLGYANAQEVIFSAGTGDYTLDLTGALQRDLHVNVAAGSGNVTIEVPQGTPVRVEVSGGVNDIDTDGAWDVEGHTYMTTGSQGPSIVVEVDMRAGSLTLTEK
jgi:hypothetical protein